MGFQECNRSPPTGKLRGQEKKPEIKTRSSNEPIPLEEGIKPEATMWGPSSSAQSRSQHASTCVRGLVIAIIAIRTWHKHIALDSLGQLGFTRLPRARAFFLAAVERHRVVTSSGSGPGQDRLFMAFKSLCRQFVVPGPSPQTTRGS